MIDSLPATCAHIQWLAERNPRRAVPLARRALDATPQGDRVARAWAVFTLGWALLCHERFDEAREHLRKAANGFAEDNDHYGTLRCGHALLLVDQIQYGDLRTAEPLGAVADQLGENGDIPRACHARMYQAIALNMRGQSAEADRILAALESAILPDDELNRGRLFRIKGATAVGRGHFEEARQLLDAAEQSAIRQKNRLEIGRAWFEQAYLLLRLEKVDSALPLYQRAEKVFRRYDLPLRLAFCTKAIGLAQSRHGEYDLAITSLFSALRSFTTLQRTRDIAACQLNLGNIYLHTGSWEAALACYSRAEDLYAASGVADEALYPRRNRAAVYRAQGRYVEALALLDEVERQATAIGNKGELIQVYKQQAELLGDTKEFTRALTISQQAYQLCRDTGNMRVGAECLLERAWLFIHRHDIQPACDLLEEAAPDLRSRPHLYWRVLYGLARCADEQREVAKALTLYREAASIIGGLRHRLASEEISSSLYVQTTELYQDSIRLAVAHSDAASVLFLSESQRALVLQRMLVERLPSPQEVLGEEHRALRQRIGALLPVSGPPTDPAALDAALTAYGDLLLRARHTPSAAGGPVSPPVTLFKLDRVRDVLNQLYKDDWTALSYTYAGDKLLMTVVTGNELWQETTPADQSLQDLIDVLTSPRNRRRIFLDLPFILKPAEGRWKAPGEVAKRLLPASVRARLGPNHRLIIAPSGQLHSLPWAALWLGDRWLAEQAILHIVPSLTTVQLLAARPVAADDTTLLLGCSDFGSRADALPGVETELTALVGLLGERATLEYPAPRAALFDRSSNGQLARYGRLHIASHGKLFGQMGLAAHLKMADEDLLLPEIAALQLGGSLVVLSACEGAAADVLPGDEVFSLSRAFLTAGASSVLASQWPVYDQAIIEFMLDLYTALDRHGDPAIALAETQRIHIHAFPDPNDHRGKPLCWGSFVLVGGIGTAEPLNR